MQPSPSSPVSPEAAAPRLLVVDDEPSVRRVCAFALRAEGWRVETEADARAALARLVGGERFDALVLDYAMPGLDGLSLLREAARALGAAATPPTILASAHADGAVAAEALGLGVWDFLAKPLTPEELRRGVRRLLARDAARAGGSPLSRALALASRRAWAEARAALGDADAGDENRALAAGLLAEIAGDEDAAGRHFRAAHWPADWRGRGPEIWIELARRLGEE